MSSPIILIGIPLLAALASLLLLRYRKALKWGGAGLGLALLGTSLILPVDAETNLILDRINIASQLTVFGRRFVLGPEDLPVAALVFGLWIFWVLLVDTDTVPPQFFPLSLLGICLVLTAFAVDPIFYGALFFAFLALVNVVLLSPPGETPSPGILRYLIFQILGMLFILFAAWLASWIDLNSGDQAMRDRSLLMLGLGFAFLLSIFPFLSWISMVGERNQPFLAGYLLNFHFLGGFLFGIRFLVEGGWLGSGVNLVQPLQYAGVIMLSLGGILALFTRQLGRMTATLMIAAIGRYLLAISLLRDGLPLFFSLVILTGLSLGVWSFCLQILREHHRGLDFEDLSGAARPHPAAVAGLLLGYFSLAGVPGLGGFPHLWALGSGLGGYGSWLLISLAISTLALILGGLRILGRVAEPNEGGVVQSLPNRYQDTLILVFGLLLLLLGIAPQTLELFGRLLSGTILG